MTFSVVLGLVCLLAISGFVMGRRRSWPSGANRESSEGERLGASRSLPHYHGIYVAFFCTLPALGLVLLWYAFEPTLTALLIDRFLSPEMYEDDIGRHALLASVMQRLAEGGPVLAASPSLVQAAEHYAAFKGHIQTATSVVVVMLSVMGFAIAMRRIAPHFRARARVERIVVRLMIVACVVAVLTTIGIIMSLIFESIQFFRSISVSEFLFGLKWSPQTALRVEQVGSSGAFGAVPLFAGTFLVTLIAMIVAVPIGLFSAIYLAEYASAPLRNIVKPTLEILAGIPTVVYGFFAALTVGPFIREVGVGFGIGISSESALAAGLVMGIMIIPFISSLSDDVITAVPQSLRDGATGLGSTQAETIQKVVLPAALPGIVSAVLLAVSRAIGETMIVVMAAGLTANLTANPLESVTTVTVQIVTLLVGDQEFDSPKTLAAFALGLALFVITLALNIIALLMARLYREKYD
ncbi:MAG: phosphate ABC transporter permease subunit PstC [Parvularculales bacterium]